MFYSESSTAYIFISLFIPTKRNTAKIIPSNSHNSIKDKQQLCRELPVGKAKSYFHES